MYGLDLLRERVQFVLMTVTLHLALAYLWLQAELAEWTSPQLVASITGWWQGLANSSPYPVTRQILLRLSPLANLSAIPWQLPLAIVLLSLGLLVTLKCRIGLDYPVIGG